MKVTMTAAICQEGMDLLKGAEIYVANDAHPHNYPEQLKDTDIFGKAFVCPETFAQTGAQAGELFPIARREAGAVVQREDGFPGLLPVAYP